MRPTAIDSTVGLAFDWDQALGIGGVSLSTAYDQATTTELYRDRPEAVPPGASVDPGYDPVVLPFNEV